MRRYLLVLDMDLLAMDSEHDLEPINYLVARQEQEPCEAVVLSLTDTSQAKLSAMNLPSAPRQGSSRSRPGQITTSAPRPGTGWTGPCAT